jgi:hypothetical protein
MIASLNIKSLGQGIQGIKQHCDIHKFFKKVSPQLGVIVLQEHHMGLWDCLKKTSQMDFKGSVSFWNDVLLSIENNRFKGGTLIIPLSRLIPLMEEHGIISPKRVQYLTCKLSSIVKVGIMCIYPQNKAIGHARFWQTLIDVALPKAKWIIGGNFNNVELIEDHSQGYFGNTMGGREFNAWNAFMASLGLMDV